MHKVVIKGNYYGRTRTLPDLNDYLHECARHPQMGAKMKRDYQMIVCNAIRTQLPRLTITNPIIITTSMSRINSVTRAIFFPLQTKFFRMLYRNAE